ncbi:MAG: hypothetical protein M3O34_06065 [Chloroflexota bacterium]|nr:hypothetical protein [Chloroflexota bacterium]
MQPEEVAASVRERIGMDVQAIGLARARTRGEPVPRVWTVMTEHGYFWFVEDGTTAEVFRAVPQRTTPVSTSACHSAAEAARRFIALHPRELPAERPSNENGARHATGLSFSCEACGAHVTRRRRTEQPARALCPRCRHAERERLRYQQDPQYRARRLAYSASRYRQSQDTA